MHEPGVGCYNEGHRGHGEDTGKTKQTSVATTSLVQLPATAKFKGGRRELKGADRHKASQADYMPCELLSASRTRGET